MRVSRDEEKGLQIETGTGSLHVERKMVLRAYGEAWDLPFIMPFAIANELKQEDWDFCEERINGVVEQMMFDYAMAGLSMQLCLTRLRESLLDALYRRFVDRQAEAGRKRWLVPGSMQDVRPNGGWDE